MLKPTFKFENKTIAEFRDEVLAMQGKEIIVRGGVKKKIGEVSELCESSFSSFVGLEFNDGNGEVDWSKSTEAIPIYGFSVETYIERGKIRESTPVFVSVPLEHKNEKMTTLSTQKNNIF